MHRHTLSWRCIRLLAPFSKLFRALLGSLSWGLRSLRGAVHSGRAIKITSLPHELLETVMLELEWKCVLRTRMTCRIFYKASKSHAVWRHLFTHLSNSYTIPIILPKPIQSYSAYDLEEIVTRWLRMDALWSTSSGTPPYRVVRQKATRASFVLVDGGRWLLVSDDIDKGSVLGYDLNSKAPDMDVSVVTSGVADGFLATSMDICIDRTASNLEFDLAVAYEKFCPSLDVPVRVAVWRIVLDNADDSGRRPLLLASLCASFPTRQKGHQLDTSLLDSEYARFISLGQVEIYNWESSNELQHCKGILSVGRDACRLRLLPNRRILISGEYFINIYPTPELKLHLPDDGAVTPQRDAPLYVFPMGNANPPLGGISPLLRGPAQEAYISFATDQALFILMLNREGHDEIAVKKLLDFSGDFRSSYALGSHRGFIRHRNDGGDIVTLNFQHSREDITLMKRHVWGGPHGLGSSFARVDEWSGRVVDCVNDLIVFDFAL